MVVTEILFTFEVVVGGPGDLAHVEFGPVGEFPDDELVGFPLEQDRGEFVEGFEVLGEDFGGRLVSLEQLIFLIG